MPVPASCTRRQAHGADDFVIWMEKKAEIAAKGIDTTIPFPVDDAGFYTKDAPGFDENAENGAARVIDDKGNKGRRQQNASSRP